MSGDRDISCADVEDTVWTSYDRAATEWRATRPASLYPTVERMLATMLAGMPGNARVLDVGCGAGVPIAHALAARGLRVTGLDASPQLLDIARAEVPSAAFVRGDMRTVPTEEIGTDYDLIVAWDSVFHVPRTDHAAVFARFARWLRVGGRLLLSLGGSSGEFTSEMIGETFFYSGFAPDEALRLLERAGFAIEHSEIDDPRSRGHLAIIARATGRARIAPTGR
jgi:cyclopropane fatty-acyl-phospholipid synthase-like methyltransferase